MPSKLLHAYRFPPVIADDIILPGEAPAGVLSSMLREAEISQPLIESLLSAGAGLSRM